MTVAVPPLRQERPQAPRSAAQPALVATPILDVRGYGFWYGDVQALFDLTLTIPRQAITALIGPSGCGKTTFLRSINRLNELIPRTRHTGDILLEGVSVFSRGTEPEVLLMDEPCSALDPAATQRIEELMVELKQSYTIVIVTHNMQQASRVSDFTGFFYLGRLIEFGDTKQVFTRPSDERTEAYITGRFG